TAAREQRGLGSRTVLWPLAALPTGCSPSRPKSTPPRGTCHSRPTERSGRMRLTECLPCSLGAVRDHAGVTPAATEGPGPRQH
uniref:Uncharacterized protein n=1 Tax=Varanus komodoensis TaxID=61221 RepID=A0A8D2KVR2_VARKO